MAFTLTPWACDTSDPVHQAEIVRRGNAAIVGASGVVDAATSLRVSQKSGTPNMSVDVAAGFGFVPGSATDGGLFGAYNDDVVNVEITAADLSNPRITQIILAVDNTTDYNAELVAVDGTPAAVPDPPTITADNYLLLATIEVDASASSITNTDITDNRTVRDPDAPRAEANYSTVTAANNYSATLNFRRLGAMGFISIALTRTGGNVGATAGVVATAGTGATGTHSSFTQPLAMRAAPAALVDSTCWYDASNGQISAQWRNTWNTSETMIFGGAVLLDSV